MYCVWRTANPKNPYFLLFFLILFLLRNITSLWIPSLFPTFVSQTTETDGLAMQGGLGRGKGVGWGGTFPLKVKGCLIDLSSTLGFID